MAEHDRTWALLVEMAHRAYPDDLSLAALHTTEALMEEQTAASGGVGLGGGAEAAQANAEAAATMDDL
jgi:hypothetical protein